MSLLHPQEPSGPDYFFSFFRSKKFSEILEPFCNNSKAEVALVNTVQLYCYEDTRVMKSFPQILKVRINPVCVDDPSLTITDTRRCCTTRIVSLTRRSSTGTRKGQSLRVGSIS